MKTNDFIPTTKQELIEKKIKSLDIIIISGDAYIDHPGFGTAIIARVLESAGFKVGIIDQPDYNSPKDFRRLGKPNLFFAISSGNMDSMVNHYTARKRLRHNDAYSPNGKHGLRPDRAVIKYTNLIKQNYKDVPIVLGGVEASLRRIPHYDYWQNKLRNSILFDSKADILCYGMAEKQIVEIAERLDSGERIENLQEIRGTVVTSKHKKGISLPEFSKKMDKHQFFMMTRIFEENYKTDIISQKFSQQYLLHNQPAKPLTTEELDEIYNLPFQRRSHPKYKGKEITAFTQIKNSVTSHRGCFGGCNFCAIAAHQGKKISSRSEKSIIDELEKISMQKSFKGTVSDIGGPSSNMYAASCKLGIAETCKRSSCLMPDICPHLVDGQNQKITLLEKAKKNPKIKNLFIASGVRYDLAIRNKHYYKNLINKYVGGLLKLAPEHCSSKVLQLMNKPEFSVYEYFEKIYFALSKKSHKKQFIVPYIIIGHPGETLADTIELALYLKKKNIRLKQIQQFTPTPMSISTCMYFTGKSYPDGKKIHIPGEREIRLMKALVQWFKPQNKKLIREAFRKAKRMDLQKLIIP